MREIETIKDESSTSQENRDHELWNLKWLNIKYEKWI